MAKNLGCKLIKNEPLKKYTSFKIGGPADLFIFVNNEQNLTALILEIINSNVPYFILGNGSNLLVSDEGYRGVVLHLSGDFKTITLEKDNIISCGAGVSLGKACVFSMQNNLSGLEFAWGIPGSCGGALFMNAGAYGKDTSSVILEATHIEPSGSVITMSKENMNLAYRQSIYSGNKFIITSLKFKLLSCERNKIKQSMHEIILKRKSKQPLNYPSAGSVFKRPSGGFFAGALIQEAGLKGTRVGDAMVSEKHSGFIVNAGNATCEDVQNLISLIKEKVYLKSGILLECEVKTLGDVKI